MVRSLGDLHPLGLYSDAPDFLGPVEPPGFSFPANDLESDYPTPDQDLKEALKDASLALKVFQFLLDLAKMTGDKVQEEKLKKEIEKAKKKIAEGQGKMVEGSKILNESANGLGLSNADINSLVSQFTATQNQINSQLSLISGFSSAISSLDSSINSATSDLTGAQARLQQAMNRANYLPGITGLQQQRVDIRSANSDIFNLNSTINSLQSTRGDYINSMNQAGEKYNSLIPVANDYRAGIQSAMNTANAWEAKRSQGAQMYNDGAKDVQDGGKIAVDAGKGFNSWRNNVDLPLVEASSGSRNLSGALESFSEGNYFTGTGQVLNGGFESMIRNGGDAVAQQYGGYFGTLMDSAWRGGDQTIKQGGDLGDWAKNTSLNAGNTFIGLQNIQQVQQSLELASAILGNKSNPTAPYQAGDVLARQGVPNALESIGKITGTVLPLTPYAPITPAVNATWKGVVVGGTGVATTINEAVNTPISTDVYRGEKIPLPVGGRGLGTIPGGPGKPALGMVTIAGLTLSAEGTARGIVEGLFKSNPNLASQTAQKIVDMSRSGNWTPPLRVGGSDGVTIRPAYNDNGIVGPAVAY